MAWITTKDGKHINTDWFDKEKQIAQNKAEADSRSKSYTPLYHGTDYNRLLKILESDSLIAQASYKGENEESAVSFARSLDNSYGDIALELNKDLLQYNYKFKSISNPVDPDEERTNRTVNDLSRYIEKIHWKDTPNGANLKVLRRELVENYNNSDYTNTPGSSAYYIKRIADIAEQKNIPMNAGMKTAVDYIRRFDNRIFDQKRYNELKAKGRIK